jgi:hypothetical protein
MICLLYQSPTGQALLYPHFTDEVHESERNYRHSIDLTGMGHVRCSGVFNVFLFISVTQFIKQKKDMAPVLDWLLLQCLPT